MNRIKQYISKEKREWELNGVFYAGILALLILGLVFALSFSSITFKADLDAGGYAKFETPTGALELDKLSGSVEIELPLIVLYYTGIQNLNMEYPWG